MKRYTDITFKYLKENKKRTLVTVIGIIMSLALISGVGFLGLSLKDYMNNMYLKDYGDCEAIFFQVDVEKANILKNDVDLEKVGISSYDGQYTLQNSGKENYFTIEPSDKGYFDNILAYCLNEGRFPENDNEVVLSDHVKDYLGIKLNDEIILNEIIYDEETIESKVSDNTKSYKIVGFLNDSLGTGHYFNGYTLLKELEDNKEYCVSVSTVDRNNKIDTIYEKADNLNINRDNVSLNNKILTMHGEGSNDSFNFVIKGIVIFVFLLIITATIFLIYNAINISVAERIKQFGILRSIGSAPKQITNLVLREGIIMCLIAIPFGVFLGYIGVWITVKLLEKQIASMFGGGMLTLKFYPVIILFTTVLGLITIMLASYGPARKAGKVNVINVIKGNTTDEKIKYYKGTLIRKTFGVEGWVAYKNIRKNAKRFRVTILSLSISLVLFIVFTNLNMKRNAELTYMQKTQVTQGSLYVHHDYEEIEKAMKNVQGIDKVYSVGQMGVSFVIDEEDLTNEFKRNYPGEMTSVDYSNEYVMFYNEDALKEMGINDGLKDNEIVLINSRAQYTPAGKLENIQITNYQEGDTIKIPKASVELDKFEDNYNELVQKDVAERNYYEFKIKKVIDRSSFSDDYNFSLSIIVNEDNFSKFNKNSWMNIEAGFKYPDLNDEKQIEEISSQMQDIADEYGVSFFDTLGENRRSNEMWTVINVFIYGFIVIVTMIGVVNVFNTITLNILLKKKEYGTLETIGMDKGQLNKMVILEGMLHGVISSIVGGILSVMVTYIAIKIISQGFTFSNDMYLSPFIIGFAINLAIVLIASLIPLNKLKKMSLVETIKNEE